MVLQNKHKARASAKYARKKGLPVPGRDARPPQRQPAQFESGEAEQAAAEEGADFSGQSSDDAEDDAASDLVETTPSKPPAQHFEGPTEEELEEERLAEEAHDAAQIASFRALQAARGEAFATDKPTEEPQEQLRSRVHPAKMANTSIGSSAPTAYAEMDEMIKRDAALRDLKRRFAGESRPRDAASKATPSTSSKADELDDFFSELSVKCISATDAARPTQAAQPSKALPKDLEGFLDDVL